MRLDEVFGDWLYLVGSGPQGWDWTTYRCNYCRLTFRVPGSKAAKYCTICGGPNPERIGHFPSPSRGRYLRGG